MLSCQGTKESTGAVVITHLHWKIGIGKNASCAFLTAIAVVVNTHLQWHWLKCHRQQLRPYLPWLPWLHKFSYTAQATKVSAATVTIIGFFSMTFFKCKHSSMIGNLGSLSLIQSSLSAHFWRKHLLPFLGANLLKHLHL
jgi:hypothetical protein